MGDRNERRKHKRVESCLSVRYGRLDRPWNPSKTGVVARDLSHGGVSFRTREFLSRSSRMIMEIGLPGKKPIRAISRVTWVRKSFNGDDFDVGNRFLEMSGTDKERLAEYMDKMAV